MLTRRFIVLILATILGFGTIASGASLRGHAQDVPIEPIGEGSGSPEIVVDGLRYLRDREVLVNTSPLQETTDEDGNTVYLKPGQSDPLGAVYVLATEAEGQATRYLPQRLGQPDLTCPAENTPFATLQGAGATYAAAGPETDLTTDVLTEIGAIDEGSVLYAEGTEQPFAEIFLAQSQGNGQLSRFVLMQENGVPEIFSDQLIFAGVEFVPVPESGASLDGLTKIGCAGVFPAFAETAEPPFASVVLQVGDQTIGYEAVSGEVEPSPEVTPTEEATPPPVPTEVPATPEPTVEATPPPIPTEVPTEEPTAVPTEEPTAVPTEEPTAVPTEEPTAVPTEEPTAVPTEEPTAVPTEEPTPVPTEEPTAAATEEPTAAPTEVALPTEVPPTPAPGKPEATLPPARPTPTPRILQPAAVVPTLPPDVPSPPASSTQATVVCAGDAGDTDANGVPARLPSNLQYAGSSYRYAGTVESDATSERERLGCVGPFVLSADPADEASLYLHVEGATDTLFRFEMTTTFTVQSEVTEQPRRIQIADTEEQAGASYRASEPMISSTYSSVSLILYVDDPEAGTPDRLLGYAVGADVFGEYVPEGSGEPASEQVRNDAEAQGIHAELLLDGQRYVLTSVWRPFGTTTNGWLTLYGREGEEAPSELVGIDPRRTDLLVFDQVD